MTTAKRAIVARLSAEGRRTVRERLEREGFTVVEAENGEAAMGLVREALPALLVADGVLPKLSGFQVLKEAKSLARPKALPVVLILEEDDRYGRGRARADGADVILTEPLLDEDFVEMLEARVDPAAQEAAAMGGGGSSDRLLKELVRGAAPKSDPITSRISDPLTGLHHKDYMTLKFEEEFKKARRYGYPLAVLMVDVENFAEALKEFGKPVAQEMLLEVAGIFLCESRDVDCAGRVADARFMLLLPNTQMEGARIMADRVFQQVCGRRVQAAGREVPIRASVGIAALPSEDVDSADEFLERALRALRTASNMGGNRICAWGDAAPVREG